MNRKRFSYFLCLLWGFNLIWFNHCLTFFSFVKVTQRMWTFKKLFFNWNWCNGWTIYWFNFAKINIFCLLKYKIVVQILKLYWDSKHLTLYVWSYTFVYRFFSLSSVRICMQFNQSMIRFSSYVNIFYPNKIAFFWCNLTAKGMISEESYNTHL